MAEPGSQLELRARLAAPQWPCARSLEDGWRPGPFRGPRDGDRELLIALDGDKSEKEARQIAEEIWGKDEVDPDWYPDCPHGPPDTERACLSPSSSAR